MVADPEFVEDLDLNHVVVEAISDNNSSALMSLLEAKASPNAWVRLKILDKQYARPPTPLATKEWIDQRPGPDGAIQRLWHADDSVEDAPIGTPLLTYAVSKGHHACTRCLLANGANPYAQVLGTCYGATAMAVALNSHSLTDADDNWEVVAMLLNASRHNSEDIYTKTDLAARRSDGAGIPNVSGRIMELKIGRQMSKGEKTRQMLDAIVLTQAHSVSLLLQAGADPNALHYFGNASGIPALASCFIEYEREMPRLFRSPCAAVLLAHGADAYAVFKFDNKDYTSMRILVDAKDWYNVAKLLNFCDPFNHQIPEKPRYKEEEFLAWAGREKYKELLYGRNSEWLSAWGDREKYKELLNGRKRDWLLAAPVPSHNNSALEKRANANRFQI